MVYSSSYCPFNWSCSIGTSHRHFYLSLQICPSLTTTQRVFRWLEIASYYCPVTSLRRHWFIRMQFFLLFLPELAWPPPPCAHLIKELNPKRKICILILKEWGPFLDSPDPSIFSPYRLDIRVEFVSEMLRISGVLPLARNFFFCWPKFIILVV